MDELYLIQLDDYLGHIDEKLELYSMLRELEKDIDLLPHIGQAAALQTKMDDYAERLSNLWEKWNISKRYLISGEADDLEELMEQELLPVPDLSTDWQTTFELFRAAEELQDICEDLTDLAERQVERG